MKHKYDSIPEVRCLFTISLDTNTQEEIIKLGIIRCMQTEDFCPGTRDFKTIREKGGAFSDVEEDIETIRFINCGGCPGKKSVLRARGLVEKGADTIAFASCIQKGTPIGFPCPFAKKMKDITKLSSLILFIVSRTLKMSFEVLISYPDHLPSTLCSYRKAR